MGSHEDDDIVQLIQAQLLEDLIALTLSDMVDHNALFQLGYVDHNYASFLGSVSPVPAVS